MSHAPFGPNLGHELSSGAPADLDL